MKTLLRILSIPLFIILGVIAIIAMFAWEFIELPIAGIYWIFTGKCYTDTMREKVGDDFISWYFMSILFDDLVKKLS